MKSVLVVLGLGISFLFTQPHFSNGNVQDFTETTVTNCNCRIEQCHATAKSTGKRCKHCVSNSGDKFCWQHK